MSISVFTEAEHYDCENYPSSYTYLTNHTKNIAKKEKKGNAEYKRAIDAAC